VEEGKLENVLTREIPYEQIENGALILLLLRECKTWESLCERFQYATPPDIETNTAAMSLHKKLLELRSLSLIEFQDVIVDGKQKIFDIKPTDLWQAIRVSFGGMSLSEVALLSRHAKGMAVVPVFGRPQPVTQKIDVFVLMPFKAKLEKVYTDHIKNLGGELGITIQRADEQFSPRPFMEKVWDGICASRLVIADCTEKNPNVFYEIGIAHTAGKKVILITRSEKDIPSDIKHFDYIEYIYDPEGTQRLIDKLRTFLKQSLGV
jgi:hypothetical protein